MVKMWRFSNGKGALKSFRSKRDKRRRVVRASMAFSEWKKLIFFCFFVSVIFLKKFSVK